MAAKDLTLLHFASAILDSPSEQQQQLLQQQNTLSATASSQQRQTRTQRQRNSAVASSFSEDNQTSPSRRGQQQQQQRTKDPSQLPNSLLALSTSPQQQQQQQQHELLLVQDDHEGMEQQQQQQQQQRRQTQGRNTTPRSTRTAADNDSSSSPSNTSDPGNLNSTSKTSQKRAEQNRSAQRAFRQRKEKYIHDLESKVEELLLEKRLMELELVRLRGMVSSFTEALDQHTEPLSSIQFARSSRPSLDSSSVSNGILNLQQQQQQQQQQPHSLNQTGGDSYNNDQDTSELNRNNPNQFLPGGSGYSLKAGLTSLAATAATLNGGARSIEQEGNVASNLNYRNSLQHQLPLQRPRFSPLSNVSSSSHTSSVSSSSGIATGDLDINSDAENSRRSRFPPSNNSEQGSTSSSSIFTRMDHADAFKYNGNTTSSLTNFPTVQRTSDIHGISSLLNSSSSSMTNVDGSSSSSSSSSSSFSSSISSSGSAASAYTSSSSSSTLDANLSQKISDFPASTSSIQAAVAQAAEATAKATATAAGATTTIPTAISSITTQYPIYRPQLPITPLSLETQGGNNSGKGDLDIFALTNLADFNDPSLIFEPFLLGSESQPVEDLRVLQEDITSMSLANMLDISSYFNISGATPSEVLHQPTSSSSLNGLRDLNSVGNASAENNKGSSTISFSQPSEQSDSYFPTSLPVSTSNNSSNSSEYGHLDGQPQKRDRSGSPDRISGDSSSTKRARNASS